MYICFDKKKTRSAAAAVLRVFGAICILGKRNFSPAQPVSSCEWGLFYEEEKKPPVPNMTAEELVPYNAYYQGAGREKVIYLTFDAGYENGNTAPILDALAKHSAPGAFFVVGSYIEQNPELIKRMAAEGHTVGNHSYHHPDMSQKGREEFCRELEMTRQAYKELTGREMPKFYRPPEGKFSDENLKWAQEMGYATILWSSAYVDWNTDSQPSHDQAYRKIDRRTYPGAIFLLHSTSQTNAEILDSQMTKWEAEGYTFGSLDDLVAGYKGQSTAEGESPESGKTGENGAAGEGPVPVD